MANTKYPTSLTGEQIDQALSDMASRNSEAYAIGKRNGADVSPSDPTYHNNSKYWAEQAQGAIPPGYDASGVVRGDIAQTAQTDEWRAQARENIGMTDIVAPLINQWDEQVRNGYYDVSTGEFVSNSAYICSANYVKIKPSTSYYFKCPVNGGVAYYDSNKSFISRVVVNANTVFTTPSNAHYLRFNPYDSYGTTYNHDISINYPSTYTGYYPSALPKTNAHIGMLGNVIGMRGWNQLVKRYHLTSLNQGTNSLDVVDYIAGHKYCAICKGLPQNSYFQTDSVQPVIWMNNLSKGEIGVANSSFSNSPFINSPTDCSVDLYINLHDLTAMGLDFINSPEEFRALFSADYYPYCSGSWADLLWENASPTSAFAAQTVSVDLTNYSFVLVGVKSKSDDNGKSYAILKKGDSSQLLLTATLKIYWRVTNVQNNGIDFYDGTYLNTYGSNTITDNNYMIPYRIYGIK